MHFHFECPVRTDLCDSVVKGDATFQQYSPLCNSAYPWKSQILPNFYWETWRRSKQADLGNNKNYELPITRPRPCALHLVYYCFFAFFCDIDGMIDAHWSYGEILCCLIWFEDISKEMNRERMECRTCALLDQDSMHHWSRCSSSPIFTTVALLLYCYLVRSKTFGTGTAFICKGSEV